MLDTTSRGDPASLFDDNKPLCDQCDKPFEPRSKSGGKPQRFCSPECRAAFHTQPQRGQRSPTCIAPSLPAASEEPKPKDAPAITVGESDEFDWLNDDAVVIRDQPETAIYFNEYGGLVIRQRKWPDDDTWVYINRELIQSFIDKLCDVAGIPAFPPRDRK